MSMLDKIYYSNNMERFNKVLTNRKEKKAVS